MISQTKDVLYIVDKSASLAFDDGLLFEKDLSPDVNADLKKIELKTPSDVKEAIFLNGFGEQIDPVMGGVYLRAKYIGEKNVYYEASFDAINRINSDRLNAYTDLAHILGATMIAHVTTSDSYTNLGWGGRFGFGYANAAGLGIRYEGVPLGASLSNELSIEAKIQRTIEEKINKNVIHFEYFNSVNLSDKTWAEANRFLEDNGLKYVEDFRNLLNSRDPRYGLKKFDFKQYQFSKDMSKFLGIGASFDLATKGRGDVGSLLKACFGYSIDASLDVKHQFEEYSRESMLFAIGYDEYEDGIEKLNTIVNQYKHINDIWGDGKLDNIGIAVKLAQIGLDFKDIAKISNLPTDDVKKIQEWVETESSEKKESDNTQEKKQ